MWLVHGLANETSLADLQSAITLDTLPFDRTAPAPVPFNLSRPERGLVRLQADFQPMSQYSINVVAKDTVRYERAGLPIQINMS